MKIFTAILMILIIKGLSAQNVGINHNGETPYGSSILDIRSATKGLLIPRHSTVSKLAIASPDSGLTVLDTTIWCISIYNGANWFDLCTTNTTFCPPGFVRVPGRNYCIEVNERPGGSWDIANTACLSLGYRLCFPGEWRDACPNQGITEDNLGNVIPLQDMTGNEEWTWNLSPISTVPTLGVVSCGNVTQSGISSGYNFRCCFGFY